MNPDAKKIVLANDIRDTLADNNCTIEVEPDEDMKGLRECFPEMENSCPSTCENQELVNKCEKGPSCFASAYIEQSHIPHSNITNFPVVANYKNYFCGLCNGVPSDAIRCGNLYDLDQTRWAIIALPENSISLTTLF